MTLVKQTRHIFSLEDIKAVRFTCAKCGSAVVQTLDQANIPTNCPTPNCQRWAPDGDAPYANGTLVHYARQLVQFADPNMTVHFEIDSEPSG